MDFLYSVFEFQHVMSFVFMSVPPFNLTVVNERALFGPSFHYYAVRGSSLNLLIPISLR
ncbi:MAG TPA: hypothetical protein VI704_00985 [Bacteroidota bacterium]|nr:hypothetical protein [Bacteroidota bacterium]